MRIRVGAFSAIVMTTLSIGLLAAFSPAAAVNNGLNAKHGMARTSAAFAAPDTAPVYIEEQADSGAAVFKRVCQECHEKVDVAGADFRAKWSGQSVFALFERIRTSMPDSNPGSLPRDDYANVVAYMLRLNGIPSSTTRLTPDSASLSGAKLALPPPL